MASPLKVFAGSESEILYEPLSTSETCHSIQLLYDVVRTCYGHRGRLKALQNANNTALTLTSASSIIFHRLSCKNPFVKLIVESAKNHSSIDSDCGLLTVLIITVFLLSSLDKNVPKMLFADLNDHIAKMCITYLQSNGCECRMTIKMDTVSHLHSVVNTILSSKPGCVLSQNEKDHICLLILKAFLNIVPTTGDRQLGQVNIIADEGMCPMKSKAFPGVLIVCPQSIENLSDKFKSKLKLVLFTTSLAGDAVFSVKKLEVEKDINVWNEILNHLRNLGRKLIELKVDIVFCQKVIHPVIKEQLEMKGIMVLDRLGAINAQAIQVSTGAHPIQSIFLPDIPDLFGYVDSAQIVKIGKKSYINVGHGNQIWTLLLCHSIPASLEETKIVCRQAIDALSRLIANKKVLFGAGCTETSLAAFVNAEVHNAVKDISEMYRCMDSQILIVMNNFINLLHNIAVSVNAGKICDFMTDSIYHHLWESTVDHCACGQFNKHNLPTAKWTCLLVKGINCDKPVADSVTEIGHAVFLDEYSNKLHAYSTAFEVISLLLRTGTCIIDKG